ncbi:Ig-like domain-containing protein [Leifsonia aquatica]|uniref:Ig-like domain-containing protein n=1 Tax=Leifsonia aquatica TaxID=144185 RepID=UPI0004685FBE|nr:Ig-like domain-containing protein [Leifsonia aquatica]
MKPRYTAFIGAGVAAALACGMSTPALAAPAPNLEQSVVAASADAATNLSQTATPTIRPDGNGTITLRTVNTTGGKHTISYTVTAPTGTKFANANYYSKTNAWGGGNFTAKLSDDSRTITLSDASTSDAWQEQTFTLASAADNTAEGIVSDGLMTVTAGTFAPIGSMIPVAYNAKVSYIDQTASPSLSAGFSGSVTMRINVKSASQKGLSYTLTAPSGTTFKDATRSWKNSDGGSGSSTVTLSADKRTITMTSPESSVKYNDGWVDETYTLISDPSNTRKGEVSDGLLTITGGSFLTVGSTHKVSYTAVDPAVNQTSVPKLAPGQVQGATVSVTNPASGASKGTTFVVKAPSGTTFASDKVSWSTQNSTEKGTFIGTLSNDNKTLTVTSNVYLIVQGLVRDHTFSLQADAGNTRTGVISDGSFEFVSGSAIPVGARTAVAYESTYVAPKPVGVSLSAPAAGAVITDTKRPVFTGKGQPGGTVTVKGNSGKTIASAVVDKDGNWTATANADVYNGAYLGAVSQDVDGTSVPYSFTVNVKGNEEPKETPEPQAPIESVTLNSPGVGGTTTATKPVFAGKGHPGATIEVKGNSGRVIASGTVDKDGNWSATSTVTLGLGRYLGSVVQTAGDKFSSVAFDYAIVRAAEQVTLVTPAIGGKTTEVNPAFTGKGQAGASIEVKGNSGRTIATAIVKADGTWSATSTVTLGLGHYLGTVHQNATGELSQVAFDYKIVRAATQVTLTSPAIGARVTDLSPTFTGKGEPGAVIEVKGNSGKVLATGTVKADGTWSATSTVELWEGHFLGTVHQDAGGELSQTGFDYTITK